MGQQIAVDASILAGTSTSTYFPPCLSVPQPQGYVVRLTLFSPISGSVLSGSIILIEQNGRCMLESFLS